MADDAGKTEKPTPKKLRDAQQQGQFPRTPDAATWVGMAAGVALMPRSVAETGSQVRKLLAHLPEVAQDPTPARALDVLSDVPMAILLGCAPMCLAAMLGAILGMAVQGVHPSAKAMKPKFSRMNPKEGIKRMFGPKAAWEGLKAFLKVLVIAVVVYVVGKELILSLAGSGALPLSATVDRARDGMMNVIWAATVAGLMLAAADWAYQRHTVMKQLMMTPKDIKDEHKQQEGDPHVKAAIRAKQMAMSRNRMMAAVQGANVVLVNPTHIAVALKYQAGTGAPRVVAKGADGAALKIRELAKEHRIPMVEDKPLARTLYRVCDLEDEIPSELYTAVARILAFVMSAGRPGRNASPRRATNSVPVPEVPSKGQLRARRMRESRDARQS
jgi:flagellar biosynthetic protein FlhB